MNLEQTLLTAFLIGILGSTHCIGMCGGIVSALTLGIQPSVKKVSSLTPYLLAYNTGRIGSYCIAGALAGILGETIFSVIDENTAIAFSRILSGTFLLALGIYLAGWTQSLAPIEKAGNYLWQFIKPLGKNFLPVKTVRQAFLSGLVWGWLPCGLVYSALVWSLSSGEALDGALIMLVFGLATLPALFITGLSAAKFGHFTKNLWLRRGIGLILIIMAVFHLSGHSLSF